MRLYYREYGNKDAPLMVFLHGGGVSGWMWEKQIQYFNQYHCLVPDLPEQGKSIAASKFSIKDSSNKLLSLIEQKAKGKKVTVIGFSLGAQVTVQMVSDHPGLIDFAIINSALVRSYPIAKGVLKVLVSATYPFIQNRTFSKIQSRTLGIRDEQFEKYYQESSQMKLETLVRILHENMTFEIPEAFKNATGKMLVTVGKKEKSIMKKSAMDLVKANPNCVGVILPRIGHGAPLANPKAFNQMVEKWLQEGKLPDGRVI